MQNQEIQKTGQMSELSKKLTLFSITLASIIAVSCVMPILPLLAKVFNVEIHNIGIVVITLTLPGVILSPISGILSDRLGRKKLLIIALIWHSLASAGCALADSFEHFLFFILLQGIGAAPLLMLYGTIIGDLYTGKERIKMLSLNATVLSLGIAFFPVLAGVLAGYNWRLPFLLPLLGLPVAWVASRLELAKPNNTDTIQHYISSTAHLLENKYILGLLFISLLTFVSIYSAVLTGVPFLSNLRFHASSAEIGLLMSCSAVASATSSFFLSSLNTRYSTKQLMSFSFCCHIVAFVAIAYISEFWVLALPIFLYGWGQGFVTPNIYNQIMRHTPEQSRGAIMALNAMVIRGSQVLGPMLSGFLLKHSGLNAIFITSASFAAVLLILIYFFIQEEKQDKPLAN